MISLPVFIGLLVTMTAVMEYLAAGFGRRQSRRSASRGDCGTPIEDLADSDQTFVFGSESIDFFIKDVPAKRNEQWLVRLAGAGLIVFE